MALNCPLAETYEPLDGFDDHDVHNLDVHDLDDHDLDGLNDPITTTTPGPNLAIYENAEC